jgi:hypothetical protein
MHTISKVSSSIAMRNIVIACGFGLLALIVLASTVENNGGLGYLFVLAFAGVAAYHVWRARKLLSRRLVMTGDGIYMAEGDEDGYDHIRWRDFGDVGYRRGVVIITHRYTGQRIVHRHMASAADAASQIDGRFAALRRNNDPTLQ